jgi:hypothetical protein
MTAWTRLGMMVSLPDRLAKRRVARGCSAARRIGDSVVAGSGWWSLKWLDFLLSVLLT